MATSAQLLKAQEAGAEVRTTIAGQPEGGLVEYSPRYKGDRKPWVYQSGRYVTEGRRYSAKDVAAVTAPVADVVEEAPKAVTPEVIEALATLRNTKLNHYGPLWDAVNVLDNAGVFAAIDAAAVTAPVVEEQNRALAQNAIEALDLEEETPAVEAGPEITPELLIALRNVRAFARGQRRDVSHEINILDNAGVFAAIDAAADCTCPADEREKSGTDNHYIECPQAPEQEQARAETIRRAVDLKF